AAIFALRHRLDPPSRLSVQPLPARKCELMSRTVGGALKRTTESRAARLALGRTRSRQGRWLSPLQGGQPETRRNPVASNVSHRAFIEFSSHGHFVSKHESRW